MCTGSCDAPAAREPATGGERGAAHQPRRPDVAVDPRSSRSRYVQPGLAEQLVELGAVLLGDLAADVGDQRRRRPTPSTSAPGDGDPDRAEQRVGQLERGRLGDVEAVEQPVADEVEVAGHGRARVAVERAQRGEHRRPGSSSDSRSFFAVGVLRDASSAARARRSRRPTPAPRRASDRAARRATGRSSRRRARGSRRSGPSRRRCSACAA